MGYNSLYIIQNFGTLCWVILILPVVWSILSLIVCSTGGGHLTHWHARISKMMFFNSWVGFFNETYLFLGMCVAINAYCYPLFSSIGNVINTLLSGFIGTTLIIFPFFTIIFYNLPSIYKLILKEDDNLISRCGAVLEGLNFLRRGNIVLYFPFFSLLRKLLMIVILVLMQPYPTLSICAVNF